MIHIATVKLADIVELIAAMAKEDATVKPDQPAPAPAEAPAQQRRLAAVMAEQAKLLTCEGRRNATATTALSVDLVEHLLRELLTLWPDDCDCDICTRSRAVLNLIGGTP